MIALEGSVTHAERVLAEQADQSLVEQVRDVLDTAFENDLKLLVQAITGVKIVDMLSDSTVETGRLGVIAVLDDEPKIRQSEPNGRTLNM